MNVGGDLGGPALRQSSVARGGGMFFDWACQRKSARSMRRVGHRGMLAEGVGTIDGSVL